MMKIFTERFKSRINWDTHEEEICVAGTWIPLSETQGSVVCGDVCVEEYIIDKYGENVWNVLNESECRHMFVYNGGLEGHMSFKCHECGEFRAC